MKTYSRTRTGWVAVLPGGIKHGCGITRVSRESVPPTYLASAAVMRHGVRRELSIAASRKAMRENIL